MDGQWLATLDEEFEGSLRLELEDRDEFFVGHAYLFYRPQHNLPGFAFPLRVPKKAPHITKTDTLYLYADGGLMTTEERRKAEEDLSQRFGELPIPATLEVEVALDGETLSLTWAGGQNLNGSIVLHKAGIEGESSLDGRADLNSWDEFRQWAIGQKPRNYIFRGQSQPYKLASTFHRTWRNDLRLWVLQDVQTLFGALIDRVSYPLELGKLEHNAAFWSILQHHGYPTPLLDWTFSPFVAAFFAYQNVAVAQSVSPRIYIFDQAKWNLRYGRQAFIVDAAPPQIVVLESLAVGNPRSGPQQSLSTVTNVADVERFIREREEADGVSYLTACDLPVEEKGKVLRELELMGITYGSLFPGIDGICRDMKDRLFAPPS